MELGSHNKPDGSDQNVADEFGYLVVKGGPDSSRRQDVSGKPTVSQGPDSQKQELEPQNKAGISEQSDRDEFGYLIVNGGSDSSGGGRDVGNCII